MTDKELVKLAFEARKLAYAPYSKYHCGAALLCKNGEVFQGCNVESAAYSPTNCAERTAIFSAIAKGVREFSAIAVVCAPIDYTSDMFNYAFPCGVCRQVMLEFCDKKTFRILAAKNEDDIITRTLEQLMPDSWPELSFLERK